MADDKTRVTVELKDPKNPKNTVTFPLKRFTSEVYEEFQEREADGADALSIASEPLMKRAHRMDDDPDADPAEKRALLRDIRRTAARHTLIKDYTTLQWCIDIERVKVDEHREWIQAPVVAGHNQDGLPEISETWRVMGNDVKECRRALRSFRELLEVAA